jgi:hypothetical protein
MNLFYAFHDGSLDVQRLNYGIITLLPKISEANKISQYVSLDAYTSFLPKSSLLGWNLSSLKLLAGIKILL